MTPQDILFIRIKRFFKVVVYLVFCLRFGFVHFCIFQCRFANILTSYSFAYVYILILTYYNYFFIFYFVNLYVVLVIKFIIFINAYTDSKTSQLAIVKFKIYLIAYNVWFISQTYTLTPPLGTST